MRTTRKINCLIGLAATAVATIGVAAAAQASPVPPKASAALVGTWVNTNGATRSVAQVDVTPNKLGSVNVDAFGACTPTYCEWGSVPATVYGASVSASSGTVFQTRQAFFTGKTEWSRTTLFGSVAKTRAGLRLTLRELTVFEDGSGRKDYAVTETFKLGKGVAPHTVGNSVGDYRRGTPPALANAARGAWVPSPNTGNLASLHIGGTLLHPTVQGYGTCSPSACNWGVVKGTAFGPSISAATGKTLFASYNFGFKQEQLLITYHYTAARGEWLTVSEYSEFTDGSGRANYVANETLIRD